MSDIEIIKKFGSIENYIYELEQENQQLKEVIDEVRTSIDYMIGNVDISEIHGTKLKQILNKIGDIDEKKN